MSTYLDVHIYVFMCISKHVDLYISSSQNVISYVRIIKYKLYAYVYVWIYLYIYIYSCICYQYLHKYIYIYIYIYICINIYIYIKIQIQHIYINSLYTYKNIPEIVQKSKYNENIAYDTFPKIGNQVLNHRKYAFKNMDADGVTSIYTIICINLYSCLYVIHVCMYAYIYVYMYT
jgi:hypothetical protein